MASLGQYKLKHFQTFPQPNRLIYKTELYKGNRRVALVEDRG